MRKLVSWAVGAIVVMSSLAGCAFSDPRIEGTPPSPSAGLAGISDASQATSEVQAAWAAVAGIAAIDPGTPKWQDMAATLDAQWLVLRGPDPVNRVSSPPANPGSPTTFTAVQDGLTAADSALSSARDADLTRAGSATGLAAAFWASLAASTEQVRQGLQGDYASPTPAKPTATIAQTDENTARSSLVCSYDQGIYGLRSALGFLSSGDSARSQFTSALATLQKDQASLLDNTTSTATPSPSPAACPGIYELPSGHDHDAAVAILTTVQQNLVEVSAVYTAASSNPSTAAGYLMDNATLATGLGIGWAVWPGWPDK